MSETDEKAQGQKSKTSKLAIASLVTPVVLWGSAFSLCKLCETLIDPIPSGWRSYVWDLGVWLLVASVPVGFGLGIAALEWIRNSNGMLKGRRFAIEGIIVSVALGIVTFLFALITRTA